MRRGPSPVPASLALAVLATASAVGLGTVLVPPATPPAPAERPAAVGLAGAATGERPAATSRDLDRASLTGAQPLSAAGPPAYVVQDAGAPLTRWPAYRVRQAPRPLERLPAGPVPGDPFTFQVGTLNILGSQHARNGTGRAAALAGAILGRGVDLVGLQEVQDDQLAVMQQRLPGWTVWPGQALGNQGVRLQIAFRDDLFELVDTGSISTVFDFQQRPIPWVLLRDRATGGEFHVIDIHNSPGGQERDRDIATGAQIALVDQLRSTGRPVLLVGDTNEHTEFACRVSAATGMVGSNGLTASGGGCSTGAGPIKIDHVLGGGGVAFSGHVVDYGAPVAASTDHAFVHATVTITPSSTPSTPGTAADDASGR